MRVWGSAQKPVVDDSCIPVTKNPAPRKLSQIVCYSGEFTKIDFDPQKGYDPIDY